VLGLTTLFVSPRRIPKLGALIKPATLFKFHKDISITCSAGTRSMRAKIFGYVDEGLQLGRLLLSVANS
jgi:hypothetical protein